MRAVSALALSLLSLSAVATLSSCKKKAEEVAVKAEPAVKLRLVTAVAQPAPKEIPLTGLIAADQRSEVTADTQGKVVAVLVERGQRVKMGQPVVQLDVRTAALSAREAQANLAAARAQKELAEEECKRAQALLDKGAITRSEYDRQSTQCTSTLQQVSAAQARADMISKSIADGLVRAPFDGQVTEKNVSPGEWVAPGRTLFTLVDDDPLKIELSVPESAVRAIHKGQKVTLTAVAQPGKTYVATVSRIGGEIGRSRSLIVEAVLDPQSDLVPGMFALAHVIVGEEVRPVVPNDAIVKEGRVEFVFAAVAGELRKTIVQVGPAADPEHKSILKGLEAGAKVVTGLDKQKIPPPKPVAAAKPAAGEKPGDKGKPADKVEEVVDETPRVVAKVDGKLVEVGGNIVEIRDGLRVEEAAGAPAAPAQKTPEAGKTPAAPKTPEAAKTPEAPKTPEAVKTPEAGK